MSSINVSFIHNSSIEKRLQAASFLFTDIYFKVSADAFSKELDFLLNLHSYKRYIPMSKELVLDNQVLSKYFFDNTVLWGVVSSLSIYDFCHVLNVSLRLNLVRRVDLDLAYYQAKNEFSSADLFAQQSPEVFADKVYFPVYRQQLELSDADIILYTNKHNGYTLVPSQRNLDYFILVKNGLYHIHLQEIHQYLIQVRKISSCMKINLENQKWIDNLIL